MYETLYMCSDLCRVIIYYLN